MSTARLTAGRCNSWCVFPDSAPKLCLYCGMPPVEMGTKQTGLTVFDITIADRRPATQADIEAMEAVVSAYNELRNLITATHGTLTKRCAEIASKYGLPA